MKPRILSSGELMDLILYSLDRRIPCSVVSVGATETFVLAQYKVLSEREFMSHAEARVANRGIKRGQAHRGITFPNTKARDAAIEALKKATAVGYNTILRDMNSGMLTERVFDAYNLWPKYAFEAYIRRYIMYTQKQKFLEMMSGRKILLISGYADEVKAALERNLQKKLRFSIVGAVKVQRFEDIPRAKSEIAGLDFDLGLLAAGVNAIILASHIAQMYGKVAFDIGLGMETLISGKIQDEDLRLIMNQRDLERLKKM